jgi:hypothetical protein
VSARRLWILACILGLALGVGACGQVAQPSSAENDGVYVDAGPVTYQLQVSRELNPYTTEDRQYLVGLPSGTTSTGLTANQLWYGVFVWAKNLTGKSQTTSENFSIVDSNGDTYYPIHLDTTINQWAWTTQVLGPSGVEPAPNTTASFGPTQGGLVLFKLPTTVYSNRPLTLQIVASSGQKGTISLDL